MAQDGELGGRNELQGNNMLLSSVILVLQETLEAALLISVLMTISYQQWKKIAWLPFGIGGGMILSYFYARHMDDISEWFDYVGQEVVNASLLVLTTVLIAICTWALFRSRQSEARGDGAKNQRFISLFTFCAASAVALAITREGFEIFIYLSSFFQQQDYFQTILVGSAIGFSIGLSIGTLLYYGLLSLPGKWRLTTPVILLAVFAGNMFSQAALQLTQADWISSSRTFWDTSDWVAENSIAGQSLYALIGYEATPSAAQLISYLLGVVLVLTFMAAGNYTGSSKPSNQQAQS